MRRKDKYRNMEQANLMLENLYLKTKGLLKEDEYDYSKTENNPTDIRLKFAPGGYDKFWNQYIKSNDASCSPFFGITSFVSLFNLAIC